MTRWKDLVALAAIAVLAASTRPARAQDDVPNFDHLKCFDIDAHGNVDANADLTPEQAQFAQERNCKIHRPKLFCTPVDKTDVTSKKPLPGALPGPQETDHLCYELDCPDDPHDDADDPDNDADDADIDSPAAGPHPPPPHEMQITVSDQFGTFQVKLKHSKYLCTPAVTGLSSTTTTTASTTSSTTRPTTTSTTQSTTTSTTQPATTTTSTVVPTSTTSTTAASTTTTSATTSSTTSTSTTAPPTSTTTSTTAPPTTSTTEATTTSSTTTTTAQSPSGAFLDLGG